MQDHHEDIIIMIEKVDRLEEHFKVYKDDMDDVKGSIKDLKTAIIGNEVNGQKGFIHLLDTLETKVNAMNDKQILFEENMQNVKFVTRGFITALIGFLFWLFTNK